MTTLTLNQNLVLRKTRFDDLEELRNYINSELNIPTDFDFRPLMKKEITPALKKKMLATKKLPASRFVNLTRTYASRQCR